jgi:hypothetical protein
MAERVARPNKLKATLASISAIATIIAPLVIQYTGWTKPAQEARIANVDQIRVAQNARMANVDEIRRLQARVEKYELKWEQCVEECR